MKTNITGYPHTVYFIGPARFETWKVPPDVPPMFWVYPRPPQRALQLTVWRRKFEFRWKQGGDAA